VFLMEPVRVLLRILGGNPVHGSDTLGFTNGDCVWNLSLSQRTGDGKFDGETFLGRLWMFSLGGSGWEEKATGQVQQGRISLDDVCFQTTPFMLYRSSIHWSAHVHLRQPVDLYHTLKTVKERSVSPRSSSDSTEQWVLCFVHM
jgi:hypothetical protein